MPHTISSYRQLVAKLRKERRSIRNQYLMEAGTAFLEMAKTAMTRPNLPLRMRHRANSMGVSHQDLLISTMKRHFEELSEACSSLPGYLPLDVVQAESQAKLATIEANCRNEIADYREADLDRVVKRRKTENNDQGSFRTDNMKKELEIAVHRIRIQRGREIVKELRYQIKCLEDWWADDGDDRSDDCSDTSAGKTKTKRKRDD